MNINKTHQNILTIVLVLLFNSGLYAQQETNYALYKQTMNVINPAYAGTESESYLTVNLRSQWITVEDSPETQSFIFSAPLGKKVGIGLTVVNDAVFIENTISFNVDFSYKLTLGTSTNLFLGIKAGGSSYNIEDRANFRDLGFPQDPVLANVNDGIRPNIGIGAYLRGNNYFLSLSAPRLLSNEQISRDNGNASAISDDIPIYIAAGYSFDINNTVAFRPSAILRYFNEDRISTDLTGALRFHDRFEVGFSYRIESSWAGLMSIDLTNWLDLGYSYGSFFRDRSENLGSGTHEVLLSFKF